MLKAIWATAILALSVSGQAVAGPLAGSWVFEPSHGFPEFTTLRLVQDKGVYQGVITSRWYGDLPLLDIKQNGDVLVFHLNNGNPRVKPQDITLRSNAAGLRMSGSLWYQSFALNAHAGSAREMKALAFHPTSLPASRLVASNGLAATPPMGWNSWNKFAEGIDDRTVREIADALVSSGLRDAGYVYINIDDGWQGARDKAGEIHANAKFPDMKALGDYVHARGLKLGIYSSPGSRSCAGLEGSYGHIQQDARTFASWGIDYLKYDLCSGEGFYNTAESVKATYQEMGEALAATGRPILYSLCEYGRFDVGAWGRDVSGNLWRTTGDIADDYKTMANIGFDKNGVPRHTGPGGWNDPDMLEIGNGGMSDDEYRTHFSLWAMMSAPLIMGNDLRHMSPETFAILGNRDVIAIDQDALGRQGLPVIKTATHEVWTKPLADGSLAVALFNRTEVAQTITLSMSELGLAKVGAVHDLWTHSALASEAEISPVVAAHGVVLLRVSPE